MAPRRSKAEKEATRLSHSQHRKDYKAARWARRTVRSQSRLIKRLLA